MSFLKVVGKKLRSVVSRDPRLINAYGILRINALATPEMVREHYLKITKDRLESNWLRDAQFSYKVLSDPELRERHDEALKKRLGIEDLFFLERKQQGLELFGFVSKDPKSEDSNKGYHRVKCITDKPLIRSTMHTESDVFFTEEVEQRFERECDIALFGELGGLISMGYSDGLFAVVNYDSSFSPHTLFGQRYEQLTLARACSCNIFAYRSPVVNFTLNKHDK